MKTDLTYLREMSGNDKNLIHEMIGIFLVQMKEIQTDMRKAWISRNYDELAKLAHKAKSSVAIMGMHELSQRLMKFENQLQNNKDVANSGMFLDSLKHEYEEAEKELENFRKVLDQNK